jgi:hypothetical protein
LALNHLKDMANNTQKESVFFLWLIVPIAVLLTLLFVQVNHNVAPLPNHLAGNIPAKKVEVKHEEIHEHADSTHADTLHVQVVDVVAVPSEMLDAPKHH